MLHRGEVIIPPSCPAIDGEWQLCDIRTGELRFYINDASDNAGGRDTEVWFSFFVEGEVVNPALELKTIHVPVGSPESQALHAFAAETEHEDGERLRQVQDTMCNRVSVCRGVVDGECWAVGQRAIMEMIKPPGGEPDKSA